MTRVFSQKKEISADVLVNTLWVSTGLAVILTVPSILIFLYFFFNFDDVVVGAVIAFGLHFVLLAFSEKISKFLMSISSTDQPKTKNHGFMASDFFTFETDEENVTILTIKDEERNKKEVHTYLENHQIFHIALNKYHDKKTKITF
mgnify:FL=1